MSIPSNHEDRPLNGITATNGSATTNGHQGTNRLGEFSLFSDQAWSALRDSLKLSAREVEITRYIFADCKEKVIAEELRLSPHTVRTYCERLYRKLNVNSRVEMVVSVMGEFLHLTEDPRDLLPPICGNRRAGRCPHYN
jgi:DNA-binding CsgD family transcriptional regulator